MSDKIVPAGQSSRVILYTTADGKVTMDVFFEAENFWSGQHSMTALTSAKYLKGEDKA